ncbi:MAG: hypothetical protein ACFFB2_15760 [Promethearchaeota archaeon]
MAENRQVLFDHWHEIPSSKYLDVSKDKYYSHPVKREIVKLLREGIEDKSPDGRSTVRHALNVQEIKDLLRQRKDIIMSPTNLYFHLDSLQEMGFIKIVTALQKGRYGRNKVKYFGRVARNLFVSSEEVSISEYNERFDEFKKLAGLLDISLPRDYSELPQKLLETKQHYYKVLGNWLVEHEELIVEENLNLGVLYDFLKLINGINPRFHELFDELFSLLKQQISGL